MNRITSEILTEGLYDILQLAEIVSLVRAQLQEPTDCDVRLAVAQVIREVVGRGWAVAGDAKIVAGVVRVFPWGTGPEATAERVLDEWRKLGRGPHLGEVCWLELTDVGRAVALANQ